MSVAVPAWKLTLRGSSGATRARARAGVPVEAGDGRARAEDRLRELARGWRARGTRVLVYGAGMHTRELLDARLLEGVSVVAFADRDPAYAGARLDGRPIVPPREIAKMEPQSVLISSRLFQEEIHAELAARLPAGVELVRLYA